ncbi:hypothetical protein V8F06_009820 [Rhypophila decipiens]
MFQAGGANSKGLAPIPEGNTSQFHSEDHPAPKFEAPGRPGTQRAIGDTMLPGGGGPDGSQPIPGCGGLDESQPIPVLGRSHEVVAQMGVNQFLDSSP